MKKSKNHCPDCIELLEDERKKLGQISVWKVCPNCGLRKRPVEFLDQPVDVKELNKTGGHRGFPEY